MEKKMVFVVTDNTSLLGVMTNVSKLHGRISKIAEQWSSSLTLIHDSNGREHTFNYSNLNKIASTNIYFEVLFFGYDEGVDDDPMSISIESTYLNT